MTHEMSKIELLTLFVICMSAILMPAAYSAFKGRQRERGYRECRRNYAWMLKSANARLSEQMSMTNEYRQIAHDLCDMMPNCTYCPYEPDKASERCILGRLNDKSDGRNTEGILEERCFKSKIATAEVERNGK